jgi:hypothetical protein
MLTDGVAIPRMKDGILKPGSVWQTLSVDLPRHPWVPPFLVPAEGRAGSFASFVVTPVFDSGQRLGRDKLNYPSVGFFRLCALCDWVVQFFRLFARGIQCARERESH